MSCPEILELYSEYHDGLLSDYRLRRRVDAHLECCARCRRYYRRVDRSLTTLHLARDITPSPGFRLHLLRRLKDAETWIEPVLPGKARIAAALIVAAAIGMWLLGDGGAGIAERGTTARAERPMPMVVAKRSYPFVTFADLSAPVYEHQVTSITAGETSLSNWVRQPRR